MSVLISGVLTDGTGLPMSEYHIILKARQNTSAVVMRTVATVVTGPAGEYAFEAQTGRYDVYLRSCIEREYCVGDISVYDDSKPGTLNDFLTALDEGDLKPDVVKRFEEMVAQAQQSAEAAAGSEQLAGQHAEEAEQAKERTEALASDVQKNAGAVAEGKHRVEQLASETAKVAEQVKQDAAAAEKSAADAEQARDDIDTVLAATLKTANNLSEIAAEGTEAQRVSRDNLGLKSAATMDPQADIRDRTEGHLAVPGAFGFGHMFIPSDVVRFNSEADFLAWVKQATPGEYSVQGANGVLPGANAGMINIRFLEANRYPPAPQYMAKAIIFYNVNGDVYYNRYWTAGNGYLIGWENLKVNETGLWNAINGKAPLNSPALTGTPTTPTPPDDASGTEIANAAFVRKLLAALVGSSPEALDTLNELAAALGGDPNFATTVMNALAGKQPLNDVLTAISSLAQHANSLPYFDEYENVSLAPLSEKARALLAQATTEEMRSVLELKSAAMKDVQTDIYDRTEGRLAIPGMFGFGKIFASSERVTFETEADFLRWVKWAKPGRYTVYGEDKVIPGTQFSGTVEIIWPEPQTNPIVQYVAKVIFFYGINGDIWHNRYWAAGNGYLIGWESLKFTTQDLISILSGLAPGTTDTWYGTGSLVLAAYNGGGDADPGRQIKRGRSYPGSRLSAVEFTGYGMAGVGVKYTGVSAYVQGSGVGIPGTYRALSGNELGSAGTASVMIGLFIRVA
ncbi:UNVERIFIED_ORG: tail fiber-like protein [Citrobacter freundii]